MTPLEQLRDAIEDKGTHPEYHDAQLARLRTQWPTLYGAIMAVLGTEERPAECDADGPYFVFHGVSVSRRPQDHVYPSSGRANTTVIGHGEKHSEAYKDAQRHEAERAPGGYDFSGVAHVSGPHRLVRR